MTSPTTPVTSLAHSAAITPPALNEGSIFTPNWAILATELAVVFFLFALIVGILAMIFRRRRIKAARFLLDERDRLAENATETFNQHYSALRPDQPLTEQELADYEQRSFDLIGELVAPWLTPSPDGLRQATREIMTIRHNDLHQIAAIFRSPATPLESTPTETQTQAVAQLQHELAASLHAERERSAQLAEALKSVSIIVSEYGRKFGVDADYKVPQILRALLYLQATDAGLDMSAAKRSADEAMANGIIFIDALDETTPSDALPSAVSQSLMPPVDQASEAALSAQPPARIEPEAIKPAPEPVSPPVARPLDQAANAIAAAKPPMIETLINLDEIELPKPIESTTDFNLDLDDIDALLDAEIARQQSATLPEPKKLPTLDDDELDLSKKPA